MYLTSSALDFAAGGASAHELLREALATRLARAQARCPMAGVTLSRHRNAMALLALFLAKSRAAFSILADSFPAQAFASASLLPLIEFSSSQFDAKIGRRCRSISAAEQNCEKHNDIKGKRYDFHVRCPVMGVPLFRIDGVIA